MVLLGVLAVFGFANSPAYAQPSLEDLEVTDETISDEDITSSITTSATTAGVAPESKDFDCSSFWDTASNLGLCTMWFVGQALFTLLSWLLWLVSQLFSFAVAFNLDIARYVNANEGIQAVWSTIRDLANLVFIFFLLWLSIQTILGLGDAKKALPGIIIAALLINFSMFFTKVIIDVSNITALQFYTGIVQGPNDDVGSNIMRATRIQGLWTPGAQDNVASTVGAAKSKTDLLVVVVFGCIFLVMAIFALLNATFIFIARVIVFIILLATSPIAFISGILPEKMKTFHSMWWSNMWNQALVAPVFMLMLWVILKVSYSLSTAQLSGSTGTPPTLASALTPSAADWRNAMIPIFNYLLIIGLLIAAVKITKQLSGQAGQMITNVGGKVLGTALGGGSGMLLRNTLGSSFSALAQSKWLQKKATSNRFYRGLHKATIAGSKASYDVRAGVPLVGGMAGTMLKSAGANIDFGRSQGKGGYAQAEKDRVKARREYPKTLDTKYDFVAARATGKTDQEIAAEIKVTQRENTEKQRAYRENLGQSKNIFAKMLGKRQRNRVTPQGRADTEASNQLEKEAFDKGKKSRNKNEIKAAKDELERLKGQLRRAQGTSAEEEIKNKIEELEQKIKELEDENRSDDIKEAAAKAAKDEVEKNREEGGGGKETPKEEEKEERIKKE